MDSLISIWHSLIYWHCLVCEITASLADTDMLKSSSLFRYLIFETIFVDYKLNYLKLTVRQNSLPSLFFSSSMFLSWLIFILESFTKRRNGRISLKNALLLKFDFANWGFLSNKYAVWHILKHMDLVKRLLVELHCHIICAILLYNKTT